MSIIRHTSSSVSTGKTENVSVVNKGKLKKAQSTRITNNQEKEGKKGRRNQRKEEKEEERNGEKESLLTI